MTGELAFKIGRYSTPLGVIATMLCLSALYIVEADKSFYMAYALSLFGCFANFIIGGCYVWYKLCTEPHESR